MGLWPGLPEPVSSSGKCEENSTYFTGSPEDVMSYFHPHCFPLTPPGRTGREAPARSSLGLRHRSEARTTALAPSGFQMRSQRPTWAVTFSEAHREEASLRSSQRPCPSYLHTTPASQGPVLWALDVCPGTQPGGTVSRKGWGVSGAWLTHTGVSAPPAGPKAVPKASPPQETPRTLPCTAVFLYPLRKGTLEVSTLTG